MFSSHRFKHIQCPQLAGCQLPNCFFSHEQKVDTSVDDAPQEYDPFSAGASTPPPAKRRRIENGSVQNLDSRPLSLVGSRTATPETLKAPVAKPSMQPISNSATKANSVTKSLASKQESDRNALSMMPTSASRPVSPPATKAKPSTPLATPVKAKIVEELRPRTVPQAPAVYATRYAVLKELMAQLAAQNKRLNEGDQQWKALSLSQPELIKLALDEEEDIARKHGSGVYKNMMMSRMMSIKKMPEEDWRNLVMKQVTGKRPAPRPTSIARLQRPSTGLGSLTEEIVILKLLRTSLTGLEKYGYVTKPPTEEAVATARETAQMSAGWEKCDRCGTRFQVIPGRDGDGNLTTGGWCRYHWGRSRYAGPQVDRSAARAASIYPCCEQPLGTEGCTEAETHVFKTDDKARLASILQFEQTPPKYGASLDPISFDCEMGYTTLGMEVIRVTAVSWPSAQPKLDVLVRPYGEVLDFNTRFSGVTAKQFATAIPHVAESQAGDMTTHEQSEAKALQMVESPAAARQMLFNLLCPDTPLIGHAIDNDLNVVRIIHPMVVDTVLLYPHPKGLPLRMGLKTLAARKLDRTIQIASGLGHDSKEDAVATGDLVIVAVADKWKKLKLLGNKFEDGKLITAKTKTDPIAPQPTS